MSDERSSDLDPPNPKAESLAETIASFQKLLLRDLKLMKHRQVIHPVLQEGTITWFLFAGRSSLFCLSLLLFFSVKSV